MTLPGLLAATRPKLPCSYPHWALRARQMEEREKERRRVVCDPQDEP
jgi:hypothetical protein